MDPRGRQELVDAGLDPDEVLDDTLAGDDQFIAEIHRRPDVIAGMHMCRGNNRSAWHAEGSYEPIAEKAFGQLKVDRFLLEYDTERAGGFEPLRFVPPKDKMVVLGLISSKEPQLESIDDLRAARSMRPPSMCRWRTWRSVRSAASHRHAPATFAAWDDQRRKLELVARTARKMWG